MSLIYSLVCIQNSTEPHGPVLYLIYNLTNYLCICKMGLEIICSQKGNKLLIRNGYSLNFSKKKKKRLFCPGLFCPGVILSGVILSGNHFYYW